MTGKLTESRLIDKIDIYAALMDKRNKIAIVWMADTAMIFYRGN